MKRALFLFLLASLAMPLFGQENDARAAADKVKDAVQGPVDDVEPPKITVRGRVFYEDTGQPLRRSWIGFVKIREINPPPASVRSTEPLSVWEYQNTDSVLTNDNGEFVMKDVEPGIYQAVIKVRGILNPTHSDRESTLFQQFAFDGLNEAQVDVAVRRGGSVSGRIRYQDGAPLIGASVTLFAVKAVESSDGSEVEHMLEQAANIGSALTDDRGYYRFAGVPQGDYMVMVAEPSVFDGSDTKVSSYSTFRYFSTSELKTYYPNAKDKLEASTLQVFLGEELQDIDITLAPRELYQVVGRVVGEGNNALVDGIEVQFEKDGAERDSDYQSAQIRTTTTDKEGLWRFRDMLPGKYVLKVSEPSHRRYRDDEESVQSRPNYATSEHKFEILPGQANEVIIRIAVEGVLKGIVSVAGNGELPDTVSISADTKTERVSSDSPETSDYESDEPKQKSTAEFHVDDLAAGEYFVSVKASDGFYAKSIMFRGKDVTDQPINVKAGETLEDFRVVLSSGSGTVKGKVTNGESSDYIYAYMMPVRSDISLYRAFLMGDSDYIGDDNTFQMMAKPGEYYLFVKQGSGNPPARDITPEKLDVWVRNIIKGAVKVRIEAGKTANVDIQKTSAPEEPN